MTWVMAQPTIFGQVICLSDIQVTFIDLNTKKIEYLDCVQKTYAMDKNIVAGFAGNVIGGFVMLSSLSKTIKVNKKKSEEVYEPEGLINAWAKIASRDFARLKPEAKEGGIHILIGGVSHSKDMGIPGMGKPTVAILKSPNFEPEYAKIGEWISIGSGASEEKYKQLIKDATGNPFHPLMTHGDDFYSQTITIHLTYEIQKMDPTPGISKHYHMSRITREGITGGNTDHSEFPNVGKKIEIKMPEIAHSLDEFLELMNKMNKSAKKALANNK